MGSLRIIIYFLTYSMVQSPSWEANWFVASQEIPTISRILRLCCFKNKEFLWITHTVEHNNISPSSTVGIQLHVSALYVGHFLYYTYSRTQLYFTQHYSRYTTTCFGPICWPFLCITHTVEHNYISPSSTVGIQLHVSALYVGHFCLLHIQSNTTIFHPAVQ